MPKVTCEADCTYQVGGECKANSVEVDEETLCVTYEERDED